MKLVTVLLFTVVALTPTHARAHAPTRLFGGTHGARGGLQAGGYASAGCAERYDVHALRKSGTSTGLPARRKVVATLDCPALEG